MSRNDKQRGLVPRLRFPGFRDARAWEEKQLKRLFAERTEKGGEELPLLSLTDAEGLIHQEHSGRKDNSSADKSHYARVHPGDIAYNTMRMWEGRSALASEAGLVSPAYTVCTPGDNADSRFFSYYFKTSQAIQQFRRFSQGLVKDTLSLKFERFAEIRLATTSLAEQRKIAACLGSLDDLIAAEARKLAALREHKNGLMQQLFPREGETRPRLRFPEFLDAPEWKRGLLGDIASISKGRGIAKSDVDANGDTPCIRYGELYTVYGEVIEEVRSRTALPVTDLVLSQRGDVIIPASGETKEDIATSACVMTAGVALGSDLNIIRSPIDGRFFSYYLNGNRRRELAKVAQGDTVAHLYPTQLVMLEIYIPVEEDEQHRIADCLSALDDLIAAQEAKLEALRAHKRGLMQQLFPSPEEAEA